MSNYQQDIDSDTRCIKTDLIVSQCSHCRGLDRNGGRRTTCEGCGKRYRVVTRLERIDGLDLCSDCTEQEMP